MEQSRVISGSIESSSFLPVIRGRGAGGGFFGQLQRVFFSSVFGGRQVKQKGFS